MSADALQLYAGLEVLTGAATAAGAARGSSTGCSASCPSRRRATAGEYARRAHAEIDGLVAAGRRPIVVGGTGLYLRAALADLDLRPPADPRAARALPAARWRRRERPRCTPSSPRATRRRGRDRADRRASAIVPRARAARPGRSARPAGDAALDRARPATRRCWSPSTMEREALYRRIDARVDAMVAAGAADEVRRAARGRRLALRAPGARLRGAAARRRRRHAARARAATPSASSPGCASCPARTRHRPHRTATADAPRRATPSAGMIAAAMRFEKWQALGNDYLIVERDALPFPLTAERGAAAVRPPHRSWRRRRARALAARRARLRRAPADLQPGRLGGRAVGQRRARGDPLPAPRRAGPTSDEFSIQTAAGEIRPTILGPTTCRVDMGRARLRSEQLPRRRRDGTGEVAGCALPARRDRQPAVRDPRRGRERARGARPARDRPGDRARPAFPNRTNVSFWCATGAGHDPRPDLRARRGGDAVVGHRRVRRRGRLRAARRRLARDRASSTAASSRSTSTSRCAST